MRLSKWLLNYLTGELSCRKGNTRKKTSAVELIKVTQHLSGSIEDGPVVKLVADLDVSIKALFSPDAVRRGILEENEGADWSCSTVFLRNYNLTVVKNENGEQEIALQVHDCALNQLEDGFYLKETPVYWSSIDQLNTLFRAYLKENCYGNSDEFSCDDGSVPLTQLLNVMSSDREESISDVLTSARGVCITRCRQSMEHFLIPLEDQEQLNAIKEWSSNRSFQPPDVEPDDDLPPDICVLNLNAIENVTGVGKTRSSLIAESGSTSYQSCRQFSNLSVQSNSKRPAAVLTESKEISCTENLELMPVPPISSSACQEDALWLSQIRTGIGRGKQLTDVQDVFETIASLGSNLTLQNVHVAHNELESQQNDVDTSSLPALRLSCEERSSTSLNECSDPLAQLGQLVPSSSGSDQVCSTRTDLECHQHQECRDDGDVITYLFMHSEPILHNRTCNKEKIPCQSTQIDPDAPCARPRFSTSPVRQSGSQLDSVSDTVFPVHSTQVDGRSSVSVSHARIPPLNVSPVVKARDGGGTERCLQHLDDVDLTPSGGIPSEAVKDLLFASESEAGPSSSLCRTGTIHSGVLEPDTPCVALGNERQVSDQSISVPPLKELCVPESIAIDTLSSVLESSFIDAGGTAIVGLKGGRSISNQSIIETCDDTVSPHRSHDTGGDSLHRLNVFPEDHIMSPTSATKDMQCSQSILITNIRTVTEDSEAFKLWGTNYNSNAHESVTETSAVSLMNKTSDDVVQSFSPTETVGAVGYTKIKVPGKNIKQKNGRSSSLSSTLSKTETRRSNSKSLIVHKSCESDVLFKRRELVKRGRHKIYKDQVLMEMPDEGHVKVPVVLGPNHVTRSKSKNEKTLPCDVQSLATINSANQETNFSKLEDGRKTLTAVENMETIHSLEIVESLSSNDSSSMQKEICEVAENCEVTKALSHPPLRLSYQDVFLKSISPNNFEAAAIQNKNSDQELVSDKFETSSNSSLEDFAYNEGSLSKKIALKRLHGAIASQKSSEDGLQCPVQVPAFAAVRIEERCSPVVVECMDVLPNVASDVVDHQINIQVVKRLRTVLSLSSANAPLVPRSEDKSVDAKLSSDSKNNLKSSDLLPKFVQPHFDVDQLEADTSEADNCERRLCDINVPFSSRKAAEITRDDKNRTSGCHALTKDCLISSVSSENVRKSLQTPKNSMPSNQMKSRNVSDEEKSMSTAPVCHSESRPLASSDEAEVPNKPASKINVKARFRSVLEQVDCVASVANNCLDISAVTRGQQVKETVCATSLVNKLDCLDCLSQHSKQSRLALQTPKNSFPSHQPIHPAVSYEDKTSLESGSSQSQTQDRVNFGRIQEILGMSNMNREQRSLFTHKLPAAVELSAFDYFRNLNRF